MLVKTATQLSMGVASELEVSVYKSDWIHIYEYYGCPGQVFWHLSEFTNIGSYANRPILVY